MLRNSRRASGFLQSPPNRVPLETQYSGWPRKKKKKNHHARTDDRALSNKPGWPFLL